MPPCSRPANGNAYNNCNVRNDPAQPLQVSDTPHVQTHQAMEYAVKICTLSAASVARKVQFLVWYAASAGQRQNSALNSTVTVYKDAMARSEEHTSELQSRFDLVCRLLLEKKNQQPRQESRT